MTNLVTDTASQIVNVGTDPRHRIEWRCDHCKKPIKGPTGSIQISELDIQKHGQASWTVTHYACPSVLGNLNFEIPAHLLDSVDKALAWTAHLAGLGWLHQTDWTALLQRCEIPTLRPSQAAHIEGQPAR